jgi:hypothetical protein
MTGPETLPPWTPRLYAWSSVEPTWTGVGVFLSLVLVYSAWSYGVIPLLGLETVRAPLWVEVWLAALIAYAPTASVYTARGTARDRDALETVLAPGDVHREDLFAPYGPSLPICCASFALLAATVSLVGLVLPQVPERLLVVGVGRHASDPLLLWSLLRNAAFAWVLARLAWLEVGLAWRFGGLAQSAHVDLFDLTPLRPFATRGLRSLLFWIPPMVVTPVLWLPPLLGLFFSVREAHRRIRDEKRIALALVRESIRREAPEIGTSGTPSGAPGRLADLIAYETRIQGVLPWLLDASALLRLAVYLLVGLASLLLRAAV